MNHESILILSGCRTQFAGQDYKNLILPTSKIIANSRDKEEQVYFKMPVTTNTFHIEPQTMFKGKK